MLFDASLCVCLAVLVCRFKVESNRDVLIECGAIRRLLHVFELIQRSGVKDQFLNTIALQYLELANVLLVHLLAKDQCTKVRWFFLRINLLKCN